MIFKKKLIPVKFEKRYKRFFADVKKNSKILTTHCPNSGSMLGLLKKGNRSWISKSDNIKRKLKYSLEIINDGKSNVGVNTLIANKIIEEALLKGRIIEFKKICKLKREVVYSNDTRFDFELKINNRKVFLEVKNVTLSREQGIAEFPDSITSRGLKHIKKLGLSINHGYDAVVIFLIQREDCNFFKIAKDIDHKYYKAYSENKKKGVKFIAYSCKVNNKKIEVEKKIKIIN